MMLPKYWVNLFQLKTANDSYGFADLVIFCKIPDLVIQSKWDQTGMELLIFMNHNCAGEFCND